MKLDQTKGRDSIFKFQNFIFPSEITCVSQVTNDTTSGMSASVSSLSVGGVATYTCSEGRRIVGPLTRKCLVTGLWDGQQPFCECNKQLAT